MQVQGRWAWGKEKKSIIERGVAERTRFFGKGKTRTESIYLFLRVLLLMLFSWCATTLLLIFLVSAPLAIGRVLYWILRVPDKFIHTPVSAAVGSCIIFPVIAVGASSLLSISSNEDASILRFIKRWTAAFRLPPIRKLLVMFYAMFLWFGFCPLLLGMFYEVCLVKTSEWFESEFRFNRDDLILCWTVGSVLLNTWACLCSFSVFTKGFWVNIGNGMLDAPPNDDNPNGQNEREGAGEQLSWQGKHGRASRFYGIWKAVLINWEWDAVDQVPLIEESSYPMFKKLASLFLVPTFCYLLWFWWMEVVIGLNQSEFLLAFVLLCSFVSWLVSLLTVSIIDLSLNLK